MGSSRIGQWFAAAALLAGATVGATNICVPRAIAIAAVVLCVACAATANHPTASPAPAPAAAQEAPSAQATQQPPDQPAAVQAAAQGRIDRIMSIANRIQVEVDARGLATLTGFVDSEDEREQAKRLARDTPGVTGVVEDLRVTPIYRR